MSRIDGLVRLVPDYPQPGILFRDITPLLADADAFAAVIREIAAAVEGPVDLVAVPIRFLSVVAFPDSQV